MVYKTHSLQKKIPEMKEEDLIDQDPLSPAALLFDRHVIYGLKYTYLGGWRISLLPLFIYP